MDEEPERAKRWEGGYERTWYDGAHIVSHIANMELLCLWAERTSFFDP